MLWGQFNVTLGSNPGFNHKESWGHQHRQGELVTKACSSLTHFGDVFASNKVVFREASYNGRSYRGPVQGGYPTPSSLWGHKSDHSVLLMASKWSMRTWFPLLLSLVNGTSQFPPWTNLLSQMDGKFWHLLQSPEKWRYLIIAHINTKPTVQITWQRVSNFSSPSLLKQSS